MSHTVQRAPVDDSRLAAVSDLPRREGLTLAGREVGDFGIAVRSAHDRPMVVVNGEVDIATAPMMHAVVRQLLAEGHNELTVDLGPATFMDCSVLSFLISVRRLLTDSGGSLRVVGDSVLLRRLIDATGLTEAFASELSASADELSQPPSVRTRAGLELVGVSRVGAV